MSNILLFSHKGHQSLQEVSTIDDHTEKDLQKLMEKNMEHVFGIRFLKSEYIIEDGRIDSIGLDQNNSPVIFEYKKVSDEKIIIQSLYYLALLLKHQESFTLLVHHMLDTNNYRVSDNIDWSAPRIICIAQRFSKYDIFAINQINANIDLIEYKKYENEIFLLNLLNKTPNALKPIMRQSSIIQENILPALLIGLSPEMLSLYEEIKSILLALDDDIKEYPVKHYIAYRKIKNIACLSPRSKKSQFFLNLSIDPKSVEFICNFIIDQSNVGHWGTGDVCVIISNSADLQKALPLIQRAYEEY